MLAMQIEFDTLKYVAMLEGLGVNSGVARAVISTVGKIEYYNLYSKNEVDNMLSETVQKVFDDNRRKFEREMAILEQQTEKEFAIKEKRFEEYKKRMAESSRHMNEANKLMSERMDENMRQTMRRLDFETARLHSTFRWAIGTIITVGVSLAGYMTALFHMMR
jgi:hypothetical protein